MKNRDEYTASIIFRPAITPFEAAVLPAAERKAYGVLAMIRYAYEETGEKGVKTAAQRAKIWVR